MRRLLYISLALMLVTMAMGCGRSVDERLVLADSLMWTAPDSSLAILNAIDRDSLGDDENLAYHALLLTQAQFRCNIPLTSDTLISTAVDYYSDNHNREHYTRALLYKGAYYEVHDNPVEAIKWYKKAEDNADTTDYRNLAQINMRMGVLYYNNFVDNKLCQNKFLKSLSCYQRVGDLKFQMKCLGYLGGLKRESDNKESIKLLNSAMSLAKEFNDTANYYWYQELLSRAFYLSGNYEESKKLSVDAIFNGRDFINYDTYFNASLSYAKLKMVDSAYFYLPEIDDSDHYCLMMQALVKSAIYEAEGKFNDALEQNYIYNAFADSVELDSLRQSAFIAEMDMVQDDVMNLKTGIRDHKKIAIIVILLFLIGIIVLGSLFYRKRLFYKKIIASLKGERINLHSDLATMIEKEVLYYERLKKSESLSRQMYEKVIKGEQECKALRDLVSSHVKLMESLIEASENESEKVFKKTFSNSVANYHSNETLITSFISFVNQNFNDVVNKALEKANNLSVMEQYVIALMAAGFEYKEIAVVTKYSPSYIGKKRSRIEKKLGINERLIDFINRIKQCKD